MSETRRRTRRFGPSPKDGLDNRTRELASSQGLKRHRLTLRVRIRVVGGEAGEAAARAQGRALWRAVTALGLVGPEVEDREDR